MEFLVYINMGDVFIDGKLVSQSCFSNDSIGLAITNWLNGISDDDKGEES